MNGNMSRLKLFTCRVKWWAPDITDSYFSILDTSKAGAKSTMFTRLIKAGKSVSNIQIDGIEIVEVKGPFEEGYVIMEAV